MSKFTHGTDDGPLCMACQVGTVWGYTVYPSGRSDRALFGAECVGCGARSNAYEVQCKYGMPTVAELKAAHIEGLLDEMVYFYVVVPWSDKPTKWHPTEKTGPWAVLTRGCFKSTADARKWAEAELEGQPYSIRRSDPRE